jgi:predicted nucleic acid-binding Zn ribbon protein
MNPLWKYLGRRRPKTARCSRCKTKIKINGRGRVPKFCSPTCRQLAYQQRKWQRPTAVQMLAEDIDTVRIRNIIRAEVWTALQMAGVVPKNEPPPLAPRKSQRRADLRIVKPQPEH